MSALAADLPLDRDESSRFLPWIIAFIVFLAVLALAAAILLARAGDTWRRDVSATLTVQIVPQLAAARGSAATPADRVEAALRVLRATPGIARAEALPEDKGIALLEPWLGGSVNLTTLPVPRLIDVTLEDGVHLDGRALAARLAEEVPGSSVDDHGLIVDRLVRIAAFAEWLAFGITLVVAFVAIATVVFTTRAGLVIHEDVIDLLHLIGARDGYVARQFQMSAMRLCLKGGLTGFLFGCAVLAAFAHLSSGLDAGLLPRLALEPGDWAVLAAVPFVATAISSATARLTVLRALGRML
jgi:cell division transport system permease protein